MLNDPQDDFWAQWQQQRQGQVGDPSAFYRLLPQDQPVPVPQNLAALWPAVASPAATGAARAATSGLAQAPQQAPAQGPPTSAGDAWARVREAMQSRQHAAWNQAVNAPLPWDTQKGLGNQSELGYGVEPLSKIHSPGDVLTAVPESAGRLFGTLMGQTVGRAATAAGLDPLLQGVGGALSTVNRLIPGYGGKFQQEHPGIENLLQTLETAGLTKGVGAGLKGARGRVNLPTGLAGQRGELLPKPLKPTPEELAKLGRLVNSPIPQVKNRAQLAAQYLNQNLQLRPEDRNWLTPPQEAPAPAAPVQPVMPKHATGKAHERLGIDPNAPHTPEYLGRFAKEQALINGEKGDAGKGTPLTYHGIRGRYQVAVNGEVQPVSQSGMVRFDAEHLADHLRAQNGKGKVRVLGFDQAGRDQLAYENQMRLRGQRGQLGGEEPVNPSAHPEEFLTPKALQRHLLAAHGDEGPGAAALGMFREGVNHDELLTMHDQIHSGEYRPAEAPIGFDETPPMGSDQLGRIVPPGMTYGPGGLERAVARPTSGPGLPPPEDLGDYVRQHPSDKNAVKILLDQAETLGRPLTLDEMQALREAERLQGLPPIPEEDLAAYNWGLASEGGVPTGDWARELVDPQRINEELPNVGRGGPLLALHGDREGQPPLFQPNVSHVGEKPPALPPGGAPPESGGPGLPPPPPPSGPGLLQPPEAPQSYNAYDRPIVRSAMSALTQTMSGWKGWYGYGDLVVASLHGLASMWRREAAKTVLPEAVREVPKTVEREQVGDALNGKVPVENLTPRQQALFWDARIVFNRIGDQAMDVFQMLKGMRDNYFPQMVKSWTDPVTRIVYKPKDAEFRTALNKYTPKVTNYDRYFLKRMHDDLESQGFEMERDVARVLPTYMATYGKAVTNQQMTSRALAGVMQADGRKAALSPDDVKGLAAQGEGPTPVGTLRGQYSDYKPVTNIPGIAFLHPGMVKSIEPLFDAAQTGRLALAAAHADSWYRATAMFLPTIHGLNQIAHQMMIPGAGRIPGMAAWLGHDIMRDPALRTEAERYITQATPHDQLMQIQGKMDINPDPNFWQTIHGAMESGLWDHIVASGQMYAYKAFRDKFAKQGIPLEEARIAAGKMADTVVGTKAILGNEKALGYFLFAYRWTENHLAIPAMSLPNIGPKLAAWRHKDITPNIAQTLSMETRSGFAKAVLVTGLYTEAMNYMLGGQSSLDNADGHQFDISIKNITGQDDYVENPLGRFLNYYLQIAKSEARSGLAVGTLEAIANKLMPPFSTLVQAKQLAGDSTPGQVSTVLQAFLPDPLRPFGPAGQAFTQGKTAEGVGDVATGLLGQSKGVMRGVDQGPLTVGAIHQRAEDVQLASDGIPPALATMAQREAARQKVDSISRADLWSSLPIAREIQPYLPTGLPFMSVTKDQIAKFRDIQTNALVERGVPKDVQERLRAQNQSPMALLNEMQKKQLYQDHPELSLYSQITPITHDAAAAVQDQQTISYRAGLGNAIQNAQQAIEDLSARFAKGEIDEFAWRDGRRQILQTLWGPGGAEATLHQQYQDAILTPQQRAEFQAKYHIEPTAARPEDLAYQQYQNIALDDPKYTDLNGDQDSLAWHADRQAFIQSLPPDVATYILGRQEANRTPMEGAYQDAIGKYVAWLSQRPELAQAYHQLYSRTSNPLQRKALETQTPGLKAFLTQRLHFLSSDPQLAFWMLHGTSQAKALARSGITPQATPAQAFETLYPQIDPLAGLTPINQPAIDQNQLAQELRQYIGVP